MSWKDIIGHGSQIKFLIQAWKTNRLGQAYFFHGLDGVGKRTLAVEFGKALLCQSARGNFEACDECPSCKLVDVDNHPDLQRHFCPRDVHEFPRELMKEICDNFSLKSSRGGAKVLVIDDCDLLNEESGNIFLKSLEEPPPESIIFLIGTSVERQLETILSRCQKLAFHALSNAEVELVLSTKNIEGVPDLKRIASACGGSISQALMMTNPEFSKIEEFFLTEIIAPVPDPVKLIKMVVDFVENAGKDSSSQRGRARWLIQCVLAWLRTQMIVKSNGSPNPSPRFQLPGTVEMGKVLAMIEACFQAENQMQRRVQLQLVIQWWIDGLIWADTVAPFSSPVGQV